MIEGNFDPTQLRSGMFSLEWPPKSGKKQSFPEIDKAEWFSVQEAKKKINPAQVALIEELVIKLSG
jgi:predicted NUDIX family NTP pyrophosphohydrolase